MMGMATDFLIVVQVSCAHLTVIGRYIVCAGFLSAERTKFYSFQIYF